MPGTTYLTGEGRETQDAGNQENGMRQGDAQGTAMPVLEAAISNLHPEPGILATADVRIGGFCTIRNIKIKEGDYGMEVAMPRTKMPFHAGYKDACYFEGREMRQQFDQCVLQAYRQVMDQGQGMDDDEDMEMDGDMEIDGDEGMEMGM